MTDEYVVRRNACIICSTSPQISESKPDLPPSKVPTTVHSRPAKRRRWPMSTPSKPSAMLCPTTISEVPARNMRPSTTFTWGRSFTPRGGSPRTTTFWGLSLPRFGICVRTSDLLRDERIAIRVVRDVRQAFR